eukprot:360468-Chlamydomonas_euryale.AAC.10
MPDSKYASTPDTSPLEAGEKDTRASLRELARRGWTFEQDLRAAGRWWCPQADTVVRVCAAAQTAVGRQLSRNCQQPNCLPRSWAAPLLKQQSVAP